MYYLAILDVLRVLDTFSTEDGVSLLYYIIIDMMTLAGCACICAPRVTMDNVPTATIKQSRRTQAAERPTISRMSDEDSAVRC